MFGREAYHNPYLLAGVDALLFAEKPLPKSRLDYLLEYLPYVKSQLAQGTPLQHMTRHILGLFKGQPGGKQFRRHLSEHGHKRDASINVLEEAIGYVS
jgi:tRNA-dihydrouridine synthase A